MTKPFVIDPGEGTREIFTLEQIEEKVKSGEITIDRALAMAYDNALLDLQDLCVERSRKMSLLQRHPCYKLVYHKAIGTQEIHKCAESLRKGIRYECEN